MRGTERGLAVTPKTSEGVLARVADCDPVFETTRQHYGASEDLFPRPARCQHCHRRHRIEPVCDFPARHGGILRKSRTAAKALYPLVRMPVCPHVSGKAIEHSRGSRSSPLDQNPSLAAPGCRVRKGG